MYVSPSFMSFHDIISEASARMRDLSMAQFPPSVLSQYASDANRDFANRSEMVRMMKDQVLVANQRVYQLPADCSRVVKVFAKQTGWTDFKELCLIREEDIMDGYSQSMIGQPQNWYLLKNRTQFGLFMTPATGGYDGRTTGAGSSTLIACSGINSTTNFYVGQTVNILDGAQEGESSVVTASATASITVSPAFTGTIQANVRFQLYPDSLRVSYIQRGNDYFFKPTACAVSSSYNAPTVSAFSTTSPLADLPKDSYAGCEVRFTSGVLNGYRSQVSSSRSASTTKTEFTVFPEFPNPPSGGDTFVLTDVPNIPCEYHQYLVDYVIANCLRRFNPAEADRAEFRYERGVKDAYQNREIMQSDTYLGTRLTMPANDQWYGVGMWNG